MIRDVEARDAEAICDIYNYFIKHSIITFEERSISVEDMRGRIRETTASYPWLVYQREDRVLGYAHASQWKNRYAYRYSVESTVYIAPDFVGQGIGSELYGGLISLLQESGFHSVIGGIALPNPVSVALHEKMGFEKVAHFREVGWKFERWIDVGYWELTLGA
jgi:L-amino acid N-acyltransferase YncA